MADSVEALSALQEELAIYLANLLSQLHRHGSLELNESSISLHFRENEQGKLKFDTSFSPSPSRRESLSPESARFEMVVY